MDPKPLRLIVLEGLTLYEEAHTLQRGMVSSRVADEIPDTLIVLQHPPVITVGYNGTESDILVSEKVLAKHKITVHKTERGGQVTYHGPGQVVGYAIVDLLNLKIGVEEFVTNLEETLIRAAAVFGVAAFRKKGSPGVYCDQGKVGAIGVRVTRGVTFHGFSFNVDPNLEHYKFIHPCGMTVSDAVSIKAVIGKAPSFEEARNAIIDAFISVFNRKII
jgi:lipoate-protein ligase B